MKRDLYEILGVSKSADAATIKKTYRKLARENHPDKNPGDAAAEERFKRISAAFDVLSDPKKRKLYDEFGYDGLREGFDAKRARSARRGAGAGYQGGASFEDIFGNMFAGGGGGAGFGGPDFGDFVGGYGMPVKGRDKSVPVTLDFMKALMGTEVKLAQGERTFTVRVPEGVENGERVRIKGKGSPAPRTRQGQGQPGDLYLDITVRPHGKLRREGLDLYLDVPVTIPEAICGASVSVPTPWGEFTVKVPEGVSSGAKLRLKEQGVRRGQAKGNFYVVLQVHTPDRIDEGVREAAKTLADAYTGDVRAALKL